MKKYCIQHCEYLLLKKDKKSGIIYSPPQPPSLALLSDVLGSPTEKIIIFFIKFGYTSQYNYLTKKLLKKI